MFWQFTAIFRDVQTIIKGKFTLVLNKLFKTSSQIYA
jgi:hypothetical protein